MLKRPVFSITFVLLAGCSVFCQDYSYAKALAFTSYGMPDSALAYLDRSISRNPGRADYYMARGTLFLEKKEREESLGDFMKADSLRQGIASYQIARIHALQGDSVAACTWMVTYLNQPSKLSQKEILTDYAFRKISSTNSWEKLWEKRWYSPEELSVFEIESLLRQKDYVTAQQRIFEALAKKATTTLHFLNARCWEGLNNKKAAEQEYLYCTTKDRKNIVYNTSLASFYVNVGYNKKALAYYSNYIEITPDSARLLRELAKLHNMAGDIVASAGELNTYLGIYFRDDPMWFLQGINRHTQKRYLDAMECLNKAIDLNSKRPEYFVTRAQVLTAVKDYLPAETDYSTALNLDKNNINTVVERGNVRLMLQKRKEACDDFARAKELGSHEALVQYNRNCSKK